MALGCASADCLAAVAHVSLYRVPSRGQKPERPGPQLDQQGRNTEEESREHTLKSLNTERIGEEVDSVRSSILSGHLGWKGKASRTL